MLRRYRRAGLGSTPFLNNQGKEEPALMKLSEHTCTLPQVYYPQAARRGAYEGTVMVRAWFNELGLNYLTLVTKSAGHQSLDDAAEQAVRTIRCKPYIENGKAVRIVGQQSIRFELR